jgi:hypothetical protein
MDTDFRCAMCDGYGMTGRDLDEPCRACRGSGLRDAVSNPNGVLPGSTAPGEDEAAVRSRGLDVHRDLYLTLPPGVAATTPRKVVTLPQNVGEGTILRIRGGGSPGRAGSGDLYFHLRLTAPPTDAHDEHLQESRSEPAASGARHERPSSAGPRESAPAAQVVAEAEALNAVRAHLVTLFPEEEPLISFVWPCDQGARPRCSAAAAWHVRVNDQVCTVCFDGRVEASFPTLLSRRGARSPSGDELTALNPELQQKDLLALSRLLDVIEGYARWDERLGRFVCLESGWVTSVQALDYYVDDPDLWQAKARAALNAAVDDEMREADHAMGDRPAPQAPLSPIGFVLDR